MENVDNILDSLFGTFNRLKEDIIKDYVNGKISKEDYLKEMEDYGRRNKI